MPRTEMPSSWFGDHATIGYKNWGKVYYPPLNELPVQRDLIYEGDWDTLFVLDACRYDMLRVMLGGKRAVQSVEPVYSKAIRTRHWLDWVWTGDETDDPDSTIPKITYYSGSPWTDPEIYDDSRVLHNNVTIKQMYSNKFGNCWGDYTDTLEPMCAVNAVIEDNIRGKKLVHLMQPHHPFIGHVGLDASRKENGYPELSTLNELPDDIVSYHFIRAAYYYNLFEAVKAIGHYVRQNPAERIILTADHAEEINEDIAGHSKDHPVPWAKVGQAWE